MFAVKFFEQAGASAFGDGVGRWAAQGRTRRRKTEHYAGIRRRSILLGSMALRDSAELSAENSPLCYEFIVLSAASVRLSASHAKALAVSLVCFGVWGALRRPPWIQL